MRFRQPEKNRGYSFQIAAFWVMMHLTFHWVWRGVRARISASSSCGKYEELYLVRV
nr:MAG TPA: hypothetical protein [Bacteriophage sp.]